MGDVAGPASALERWRSRKGAKEGSSPGADGPKVSESPAETSVEAELSPSEPEDGAGSARAAAEDRGSQQEAERPGATARALGKIDQWVSKKVMSDEAKPEPAPQAEAAKTASTAGQPPAAQPAPKPSKLDRWKSRVAGQAAAATPAAAAPAPANVPTPGATPGASGPGETAPVPGAGADDAPAQGALSHPVPSMEAWLRRANERRWTEPLAHPGARVAAAAQPAPTSKLDRWKNRVVKQQADPSGDATAQAEPAAAAEGVAAGVAAAPASKLDRWKKRVAAQKADSAPVAAPAAPPAAQKPAGSKLDRWKHRVAQQNRAAADGQPQPGGAAAASAAGEAADGAGSAEAPPGAGKASKLDRWKKRVAAQKAGPAADAGGEGQGATAVPVGAGSGEEALGPEGGIRLSPTMVIPRTCPAGLGAPGAPKWARCGLPELDAVYVGRVLDGRPHGIGSCLFADGSHYHGSWREGRLEGTGKMQWPDGSLYAGGFADGKPVHREGERPAMMFNAATFDEMQRRRPSPRALLTWTSPPAESAQPVRAPPRDGSTPRAPAPPLSTLAGRAPAAADGRRGFFGRRAPPPLVLFSLPLALLYGPTAGRNRPYPGLFSG
jgi:hypothetical protein